MNLPILGPGFKFNILSNVTHSCKPAGKNPILAFLNL
jgi:hypothetical protein